MSIYDIYTSLENDRFLLRPAEEGDCEKLLKVYSDKFALPFFNSDNCDGDIFYYDTPEKMAQALAFWDYAYKNRWFARLTVIDKQKDDVIGTVELCLRASRDSFNKKCILRIDLRNDCEEETVLYELFSLILPEAQELMGGNGIVTKIPGYAVERAKAAEKAGFVKSENYLIGKNGYPYDGYWIRLYPRGGASVKKNADRLFNHLQENEFADMKKK